MTNGTNTKTLKDQLESETAATELSAAEELRSGTMVATGGS